MVNDEKLKLQRWAGQAADVIIAWADGKRIERREPGEQKWKHTDIAQFNEHKRYEASLILRLDTTCEYRVKPEPKYRPWTVEELLKLIKAAGNGVAVTHQLTQESWSLIGVVWKKYAVYAIRNDNTRIGVRELLQDYKCYDGSPCGAIMEITVE